MCAVAQNTSMTNDAKTFNSRLEEERASTRRMEQAARRATEDRDSLQSSVDIKVRELDRLHGASPSSLPPATAETGPRGPAVQH